MTSKKSRQPNGASSVYQDKNGRWHGRVTVGVKDDGKPDRRHVTAKTRPEAIKKVRELEKLRDAGTIRKAGSQAWTVGAWLTHWITQIAPLTATENTLDGYEVAVRVHLVPGLGAHKLVKLEAEHLERFYAKMQRSGSKPATAHQAHRTLRVALAEAVRRGHLVVNQAVIAKAPRLDEEEVEPYTVEEVQRLLAAASKRRNATRWVFALALGLRQGEVLGLQWNDVDLASGVVRVKRGRLRPRYAHGCGDTCGRKPGYCPRREQIRRETKDTKSRAGKRSIGLPDQLVQLLVAHKVEQDRERGLASDEWTDKDYVFASLTGEPLIPNTDYHHWKELLAEAEVRDGRLHDARHTASTVLLLLGVPERIVMAIMGWSSSSMAKRYQHVTDPLLAETAQKVDGLLWGAAEAHPVSTQILPPRFDVEAAVPLVFVARVGQHRIAFASRELALAVVDQWGADHAEATAAVEEWESEKWELESPLGRADVRESAPTRRLVHRAVAVFLPGGSESAAELPEQWAEYAWEFETDAYTARPVAWRTLRRSGSGQEVEAHVRGTDAAAVAEAFAQARVQAIDRAKNPGKYGDTDEW